MPLYWQIAMNRKGKSRGFAFIEMENKEDAQSAVEARPTRMSPHEAS